MTAWTIIPRPTVRLLGDETSLSAAVVGATIIINGEPLDLSGLEDGDVLPRGSVASPMIRGEIRRTGEVIEVPLRFPIDHDAPEEARFPVPIIMIEDGPVPLPPAESPDDTDEPGDSGEEEAP